MKPLSCVALLAVAAVLASCNGGGPARFARRLGEVPDTPVSPDAFVRREVRVVEFMIPRGTAGRKEIRPLVPQYITIHSTRNPTGSAWDHARALRNGSLTAPKRRDGNRIGFLTWHYTVQDNVVIQHLPAHEQGEHADFDGPGNRYSIGIEMCEHAGNDLAQTIDRTARLTAWLMYRHGIPLRNVVPHYHWPRRGVSPAHKNCPHFLLDNGRPGRTWRWFLDRVDAWHRRLQTEPAALASAG